jgi:hypothetical protein
VVPIIGRCRSSTVTLVTLAGGRPKKGEITKRTQFKNRTIRHPRQM